MADHHRTAAVSSIVTSFSILLMLYSKRLNQVALATVSGGESRHAPPEQNPLKAIAWTVASLQSDDGSTQAGGPCRVHELSGDDSFLDALRKVEEDVTSSVPGGLNCAVLLTADAHCIRQVIHPHLARLQLDPPSEFWMRFIALSSLQQPPPSGQLSPASSDASASGASTAVPSSDSTTSSSPSASASSSDEPRWAALAEQALQSVVVRAQSHSAEELLAHVEHVRLGFQQAVVCRTSSVGADEVVRARGLPWQASDQHVAQFFAGLNIAPGGVALCLSAEGRRNGEALVRFESAAMRRLALHRHRHFLLSRYIEVYRASPDEFLQVAAGSSVEAAAFVSRGAAMIVRMRGLPYDATVQQIRDFFAAEPEPADMMENGILFVNRADGRPTGDAFVLFPTDEQGKRALTKHKQTIGTRYIELFRSTQAEVQQVVNKSLETVALPPCGVAASRRDCIRLRGLPYEASVQHIVDFLGDSSKNIVYQGVHMVFNSAGHPSGEAFIQMSSESTAAAAATASHNKFMNIGKKQRYIEVFQCSPDDMHLVVAGPAVPSTTASSALAAAPQQLVLPRFSALGGPPPPSAAASFGAGPPPTAAAAAAAAALSAPLFWGYPSPPVSPAGMLGAPGQIYLTGLGPQVSAQEIVAQLTAVNPDLTVESVQWIRPWQSVTQPGEALVRLRPSAAAFAQAAALAAVAAAAGRLPVPPPPSLTALHPAHPPHPLPHDPSRVMPPHMPTTIPQLPAFPLVHT